MQQPDLRVHRLLLGSLFAPPQARWQLSALLLRKPLQPSEERCASTGCSAGFGISLVAAEAGVHDCDRRSRGGFVGNGDRGRRTRHRLRRNEAWRRLGRLHRSNRRGTGSHRSGLATLLGGRAGTADGGATVCRGGAAGVAAAAGREGTCGWAAFCVIAFSTSPGLEMCDRSILGLNSSACARELRLLVLPGSPCSA